MANHADEALTASDLVMHIKKARRAIAHLACEFDGAPDTIRTYDTRFRRAVLYPLSYGGVAMCASPREPASKPSSRASCGARIFLAVFAEQ